MTKDHHGEKRTTETYFISLIVCLLLMAVSFIAAAAKDEGTQREGIVWDLLADSFELLRYPIHGLFENFILERTSLYFPGLIFNVFFWALLMGRVSTFLKNRFQTRTK